MFENIKQEVISIEHFLVRVFKYFLFATLMLIVGIIPGIIGFIYLGGLSLDEAVINAISILGTINIPYPLESKVGHVFTGLYGLFVETVFFVALGILIAPIVHRAFHKLHIGEDENE